MYECKIQKILTVILVQYSSTVLFLHTLIFLMFFFICFFLFFLFLINVVFLQHFPWFNFAASLHLVQFVLRLYKASIVIFVWSCCSCFIYELFIFLLLNYIQRQKNVVHQIKRKQTIIFLVNFYKNNLSRIINIQTYSARVSPPTKNNKKAVPLRVKYISSLFLPFLPIFLPSSQCI